MTDAAEVRAFEAIFTLLGGVDLHDLRFAFRNPFIDAESSETKAMGPIDRSDFEDEQRPFLHADNFRGKVKVLGGHLDGFVWHLAPIDVRRDCRELLGGAAPGEDAGSENQR